MSEVKSEWEELRIRYETEGQNSYLDNVGSLSRYFIWASKMRHEFDGLIANKKSDDEVIFLEHVHVYMSYWYGALYVVAEGWKDLNLEDEAIDKLLNSPYLALLRKYRNAVFHFQRRFSHKGFMNLMFEGEEAGDWVRSLHSEFGRYFMGFWKAKKEGPAQ